MRGTQPRAGHGAERAARWSGRGRLRYSIGFGSPL